MVRPWSLYEMVALDTLRVYDGKQFFYQFQMCNFRRSRRLKMIKLPISFLACTFSSDLPSDIITMDYTVLRIRVRHFFKALEKSGNP